MKAENGLNRYPIKKLFFSIVISMMHFINTPNVPH